MSKAASIDFGGKVVLISGGSGALGRSVTKAFLESGAIVAVLYIIKEEVETLLKEIGGRNSRLLLLEADVLKEDQVKNAVEGVVKQFGKIDVLVNLVGGYIGGTAIADTEEKDWDLAMDLNLKSAFLMCKATIPHMIAKRNGRIINTSSRSGLKGEATDGPYSVSKAGVIRLTETIADEVREFGITANAIMPSVIDTPANRRAMPDADFSKWVKPSDIARVVMWLASTETGIISGAAVPVYGLA